MVYFRGILYNIVLNIKQSNTDSDIENLKSHIESHQEKIKKVSEDLTEFSDKLLEIEEDLSNLKEANEDFLKLKNIQEGLAGYATSLRTEDTFLPSGSGSSYTRINALVAFFCILSILNNLIRL